MRVGVNGLHARVAEGSCGSFGPGDAWLPLRRTTDAGARGNITHPREPCPAQCPSTHTVSPGPPSQCAEHASQPTPLAAPIRAPCTVAPTQAGCAPHLNRATNAGLKPAAASSSAVLSPPPFLPLALLSLLPSRLPLPPLLPALLRPLAAAPVCRVLPYSHFHSWSARLGRSPGGAHGHGAGHYGINVGAAMLVLQHAHSSPGGLALPSMTQWTP